MKNKIISFFLVLFFIFSFPIPAYAVSQWSWTDDSYIIDTSNLPDLSSYYIQAKQLSLNVFLFYRPTDQTWIFFASTDFYNASSAETFQFIVDDTRIFRWLIDNAGHSYGNENNTNSIILKWSSLYSDWQTMDITKSSSYGSYNLGYIDITNCFLVAFDMNNVVSDSSNNNAEVLLYRDGCDDYKHNLQVEQKNPATRRLYFTPTGGLSLSADGPDVNGNGNVDLTETNGLISDLTEKIDSILTYVQNIRTHTYNSTNNVTTIKNDIADIKSNISTLVNSSSNLSGIKSVLDNIYNDLHDFKIIIHWDSEDENFFSDTYSLLESLVSDKFGTISKSNTVLYFLKRMHDNIGDIKTTLNSVLTSIGTTFKTDMQNEFTNLKSNISTNFTNLQTYLTGKYETLYNVIIYGDKNGDAAYQAERLEIEEQQAKLDDINTKIGEAPAAIDGAADNVSDYISTFTLMYNNFVGLNVAISSVLYFGLAFILIKKVIGR